MSKLRRQVIQALNIKAEDSQGQIKTLYDPYKDSLDNVLNSSIDEKVASTINTNPYPLRQSTSVT